MISSGMCNWYADGNISTIFSVPANNFRNFRAEFEKFSCKKLI
jgi:hypothetical protein